MEETVEAINAMLDAEFPELADGGEKLDPSEEELTGGVDPEWYAANKEELPDA